MARSSLQSTQRYPLTQILGTEANVRLLRELSRHGGQLSAPSLVSRTGLAKTSVWAGLSALDAMGVIAVAGSGRVLLYSVRSDHPLSIALGALFEAEEQRFDDILEAIRNAARGCTEKPVALWLYGSAARGEDRPDSDLDIVLVSGSRDPSTGDLEAMRDTLHMAGEKLGFQAAVIGLGSDDIARLSGMRDPWWLAVARDAVVLSGLAPNEIASPRRAAARRRTAA